MIIAPLPLSNVYVHRVTLTHMTLLSLLVLVDLYFLRSVYMIYQLIKSWLKDFNSRRP